MGKRIVILATASESTNIVFHALNSEFSIEAVILEENISQFTFLKKRIKKLGLFKVVGQVIFQFYNKFILQRQALSRLQYIRNQFDLNNSPLISDKIFHVPSANSNECIKVLHDLQPDIIVVNGTRIISRPTLNACNSIYLNIHAGITPLYRGVHGGYWALVNNDKINCGVTVHIVDSGIDTGKIIYQGRITVGADDNFSTYPLLQLAVGLPLLIQAIKDISSDCLSFISAPTGNSRLWSHPTLWEYIQNRRIKKIK
ncbi:formyl transferase [Rufibacter aurantiacus]|uniref:formyl transferase n=1 Tax=Rufibacter aurantiacus TaxID=2817374 RepID=UPI001B30E4FC|nr:formyl transferase [Rufibacter aurantiacus]